MINVAFHFSGKKVDYSVHCFEIPGLPTWIPTFHLYKKKIYIYIQIDRQIDRAIYIHTYVYQIDQIFKLSTLYTGTTCNYQRTFSI